MNDVLTRIEQLLMLNSTYSFSLVKFLFNRHENQL